MAGSCHDYPAHAALAAAAGFRLYLLLLLLFLLLLLLLMPLLLLLLIIASWRTLLGLSWGHHSCHFAEALSFSILFLLGFLHCLLTPLAAADFVSAAA